MLQEYAPDPRGWMYILVSRYTTKHKTSKVKGIVQPKQKCHYLLTLMSYAVLFPKEERKISVYNTLNLGRVSAIFQNAFSSTFEDAIWVSH